MMPLGHENQLHSFQEIVKDYIAYKLRQNNNFLPGYNVNSTPSVAARHLRRVADELIEEDRQLFDSMCDQLQLTHASTYATFVGIADEIFQTGKNWGRIVAFVAFGATLAVYCIQREDLAPLIDNIIEWASLYMKQNLGPWINDNGGWAPVEDAPHGDHQGTFVHCWQHELSANATGYEGRVCMNCPGFSVWIPSEL